MAKKWMVENKRTGKKVELDFGGIKSGFQAALIAYDVYGLEIKTGDWVKVTKEIKGQDPEFCGTFLTRKAGTRTHNTRDDRYTFSV